MKTLNLVGGGRVGKTLAHLWHGAQQLQIQDVLTTSAQSAQRAVSFIGAGRAVADLSAMREADLWMLVVPDSQIALSAAAMAQHLAHHAPASVFHCSGALDSGILSPLKELGWSVASAHCILSFADPASAVQQFPGTVCGIEGNAGLASELTRLFGAIGAQSFALQAEHKLRYHAAAVFATNFLPVLQQTAETLWLESGVPANLLPQLRERLLRNAVDNLLKLGPTGALTGPAARGDSELVARQALALDAWDPVSGQAYRHLSELARRMAAEAGKP
jgi:predicted short-subunit dehydrogenase-like oxidoreductase (DUF2520 family)